VPDIVSATKVGPARPARSSAVPAPGMSDSSTVERVLRLAVELLMSDDRCRQTAIEHACVFDPLGAYHMRGIDLLSVVRKSSWPVSSRLNSRSLEFCHHRVRLNHAGSHAISRSGSGGVRPWAHVTGAGWHAGPQQMSVNVVLPASGGDDPRCGVGQFGRRRRVVWSFIGPLGGPRGRSHRPGSVIWDEGECPGWRSGSGTAVNSLHFHDCRLALNG